MTLRFVKPKTKPKKTPADATLKPEVGKVDAKKVEPKPDAPPPEKPLKADEKAK